MTGFGLLSGLGAGTPQENEARARELGAEVKANLMEAAAIENVIARNNVVANSATQQGYVIARAAEVEAIAAEVERERQETAARIASLNEARADRAAVLARLRAALR